MNATEILQALEVIPNKDTMKHAGDLAAIYKLFLADKKRITLVTTEPAEVLFGRKVERTRVKEWGASEYKYVQKEEIINEGDKMPATKFNVTTITGRYAVAVPTGNSFYIAMCKALGVFCANLEKVDKVVQTFTFPAGILEAIGKARVFVSKDGLRPAVQHICIEIRGGEAQVVATDCHKLFASRKYPVTGPAGDYAYLVNPAVFKKIPKPGTEVVKMDVLGNGKVRIAGVECETCDERYVDWKVVVPEYKTGITFDRVTMIEKTKEVMPHANKSTNMVRYYMNGQIDLHAQDVDFGTEGDARMAYISKDIDDFEIGFNGKFMVECLKTFKGVENVTMQTCGLGTKGVVLTDSSDIVVLMPLCLHN